VAEFAVIATLHSNNETATIFGYDFILTPLHYPSIRDITCRSARYLVIPEADLHYLQLTPNRSYTPVEKNWRRGVIQMAS
jgi:hypothetical protein